MNTLKILVLVFHILVSLALIVSVLLHAGRGGGLSGLFGGPSGSIGGTSVVQKNLDRITIASAFIFAATTMILIFIYK
ncbi:MAG: preprotein translocase subunit SecG [Candidatus Geothermincolia bacterium]